MGINRSAWWSSLRIVSVSLLAARDVLRNVISSDVRSATKQGCSQAKTGPLQEVYSNSSLLFRQRDLPRSLATPPRVQFLACNGALGVSHWTQVSLTEPPSREEAEGRDFLFLPSITPCLISIKNFKFRGFHGSPPLPFLYRRAWEQIFNPTPTKKGKDFTFSCKSEIWVLKSKSSFSIERTLVKGAVSRNSAKLGSYKMPVKLREA